MSSGPFEISKYAAQYGAGDQIHPIRIQPETALLTLAIAGVQTANSPPAGAVTNPISAKVGIPRNGLGLKPFVVRFRFTGTPPTGYKANSTISLPILNTPLRAVAKGAEGVYLENPIVVVGTSVEQAQ
jgi:hypothetical protein